MTVRDLLLFLIGNREAIERCASDRRALWIGLFYVLIAAVARDYDHEYFLAEPWHLVIPAGASLVTSFVLFVVVQIVCRLNVSAGLAAGYRQFLSLFWLTAPLAWFYAIPFERIGTQYEAVQGNLRLLLIVAVWRVVLMVRALMVLYSLPVARVLGPVLLVSDAIAIAAMLAVPFPMIALMGGAPAHERLVVDASITVLIVGVYSSLLWGGWTLFVWVRLRGTVSGAPPVLQATPRALSPWLLGAAVLAIGSVWIASAQGEQRSRVAVERAVEQKRLDDAIELLTVEGTRFPPHWEPPPTRGYYGNHTEVLFVLLEKLDAVDAPPSVRGAYERKLGDWFTAYANHWDFATFHDYGIDANRCIGLLLRYPDVTDWTKPFLQMLAANRDRLPYGIDRELVRRVLRYL